MDAMQTMETADAAQTTGTVIETAATGVRVWTPEGVVDARRAVSCLVAPEEGDLVLLAGPCAGTSYILAVLARPDGRARRIAVEGDVVFEMPSGRFTIAAARGVDIVAKETVSLTADRLEARARESRLLVGSISVVARVVDATFERLSQSVKRVFRRVEEIDHLRAGQIDHAAAGNARLHAQNTLITARELVKADGKQIHIG